MAVVIIGSLLTACMLLLQGVHVLRNGNLQPFFFEQSDDLRSSERRFSFLRSVALASLYILPSAGIFCLLAIALFKADTDRVIDWLSGNVFDLLGGLLLLTYGLKCLLWPDRVIRSLRSVFPDSEPEFEEQYRSVIWIVRSIGVGMSALSLFILKKL
jgi:hypothetical protein